MRYIVSETSVWQGIWDPMWIWGYVSQLPRNRMPHGLALSPCSSWIILVFTRGFQCFRKKILQMERSTILWAQATCTSVQCYNFLSVVLVQLMQLFASTETRLWLRSLLPAIIFAVHAVLVLTLLTSTWELSVPQSMVPLRDLRHPYLANHYDEYKFVTVSCN